MPRLVKCGLIQTSMACSVDESIATIRQASIDKTMRYIEQAGREGVQMLCTELLDTHGKSASSVQRAVSRRVGALCSYHTQVLFRSLTQQGVVPLTGTRDPAHMLKDRAIFDFALDDPESGAIALLR